MYIILSLFGPLLFGYLGLPFVVALAWAIACAAGWMWGKRAELKAARENAYGAGSTGGTLGSVMIFVAVATCFAAGHSAAFYLAQMATT